MVIHLSHQLETGTWSSPNNMKVTLTDVAKVAGVSRATVDRVINDRGNVRRSTVDRVYRALYSTNYLLETEGGRATGTLEFKFDFVLPVARSDNAFFTTLEHEIQALESHFDALGAKVNVHAVEHDSPELLAEKLLELGKNTDGIAFSAPDLPVVRSTIDSLSERGIGCVSLFSDISSTSRLGYAGVDNRAAGRTAGLLMARFLSHHESGKIALFTGSHSYRGNEEREAGFKSIIRESFSHFKVVVTPEMHDDNALSEQIAEKITSTEKNLVGIYNDVGGGSLGIARALKAAKKDKSIVYIAHELNSKTRTYLLDGTIDVIVDQGLRHQIYIALEMLANHKNQRDIETGILHPQFKLYFSENCV